MKLFTKTYEHKGYTINISAHHDEHHGAPWEEADGHGIVSDWTTRDKRAGELVLNSDRQSKRYYDLAATMKIAKRDGWGLSAENIAILAKRIGRQPTKKEIVAESVCRDFEYLKGWCNDEWTWQGYTTEIISPDGTATDGDSCWGYDGTDDGEKYMLGEALSHAQSTVDSMILTEEQTAIAECCP